MTESKASSAHRTGNCAILPFDELRITRDSGVVDQHIHAAPTRDYLVDRRIDFGVIANADLAKEWLASERG